MSTQTDRIKFIKITIEVKIQPRYVTERKDVIDTPASEQGERR